jgi:hypothetical protein
MMHRRNVREILIQRRQECRREESRAAICGQTVRLTPVHLTVVPIETAAEIYCKG